MASRSGPSATFARPSPSLAHISHPRHTHHHVHSSSSASCASWHAQHVKYWIENELAAPTRAKFEELADELFERCQKPVLQALEDANLKDYAGKAGLDVAKWETCYKSNKYQSKILGEQKLAAKFGARGTPAFFVNGRFLSGAQPFPAFEKLIDEELKKAKASGVARGEYYAKNIVAKGAQKL